MARRLFLRALVLLFLLFISTPFLATADKDEAAAVAVETKKEVKEDEGGPIDPAATPAVEEEIVLPEDDGTGELTEEQMSVIKSESEPYEFQAEVYRLMDIIINSLYTHKEVFLRELISNSADALEKIRFLSLENPAELKGTPNLRIVMEFDSVDKTLSIVDTGVGMTKQDLINNLGTVAKSGTANFLEALQHGGDVNLIGQFGVGFYSAFLVADKVTVTSKHNDDDQHIWVSTADASFTVAKDPRGNTLGRGTRITLHMKEDSLEFLHKNKLTEILTKYSQFVNFPIYLRVEEKVSVEEAAEEETKDKDEEEKDEDVDVVEDEATEKPKTKSVDKFVLKLKQLNKQKPLWLRPKEEITDEEYVKFYRSLAKDDYAEAPLTTIHFSAEGEVEFRAILFVPGKQLNDPYQAFFGKKQDVKLYVRRVLVAEQFEDIIPNWMTFLKGVIDSDDLPLKVDREAVSQHKVMKVITKRVARKVLEVLRKLCSAADKAEDDIKAMTQKAEEEKRVDDKGVVAWSDDESVKVKELNETSQKYDNFWKEFGKNVRLGCMEDSTNRPKISKLLRFFTTKSPETPVSLQRVVDRMGENQTTIYYISGDSAESMMASPLLQAFIKRDLEVLLMPDAVDEPCVSALDLFDGKKLKSIEKGDVELDETEEEKEYRKKITFMYKPLTDWWKGYVTKKTKVPGKFGSRFTKVAISNRLVDDPVAVAATVYGISSFNEKVYRYQTFADEDKLHYQRINRVLDINPQHPIIREMLRLYKADGESEALKVHADLLLQTALLSSGYNVDDPLAIARQLHSSLQKEMQLDTSASLELDPVDVGSVELPAAEEKKEGEAGMEGMEGMEDLMAEMGMHSMKVPKVPGEEDEAKEPEEETGKETAAKEHDEL